MQLDQGIYCLFFTALVAYTIIRMLFRLNPDLALSTSFNNIPVRAGSHLRELIGSSVSEIQAQAVFTAEYSSDQMSVYSFNGKF